MKFNKFYIKIFILFIIFYIILSTFFSSVFAKLHIDENYDYMYAYEPFIDENIQNAIDNVQNDDRVSSGDYYYFIFYNYGDRCFNTMLFRKSALEVTQLKLLFSGWGEYSSVYNCETERFYLQLPDSFSSGNGNLVWYAGRNMYESSTNRMGLDGLPDLDNKRYRFPFATNYSGDIVREMNNGETYYFYRGQPYLADNDYTLSNLNGSYFLIYPRCR